MFEVNIAWLSFATQAASCIEQFQLGSTSRNANVSKTLLPKLLAAKLYSIKGNNDADKIACHLEILDSQ
eukprot:4021467-Amphidinium_carterae.1